MNKIQNTLYILDSLSTTDSDDHLNSAEIEVFYEGVQGDEVSTTYDMPTIADKAIETINDLSKTIKIVEYRNTKLKQELKNITSKLIRKNQKVEELVIERNSMERRARAFEAGSNNILKENAELEKELVELKVVISYLDAKITSASNCHERATPILLMEALERTHLDFHRKALKAGL